MFSADDRLPNKISDGLRYERSKKLGKEIRDAIALKRKADKEKNKDTAATVAKKAKATYMVDGKKYGATATEAQLAQELTLDDLGTEETHKILQCKIRQVISFFFLMN
jgi:hypothetical protein